MAERSKKSTRHQAANGDFKRNNTLVPKVLASDVGSRFTDIVRSVRHEVDIVLLGTSTVGKTAICRQFTQAIFNENYTKTVIFEYDSRLLDVDGEIVQVSDALTTTVILTIIHFAQLVIIEIIA